ncbi:MAG TPA: hypothetical protein VJ783_00160 [Pirellulales bacterium]|nr:hypothetical protein [Pirellulales bacterium]
MQILFQFLLRLSLGMAGAMAVTSPRRVTSGFYRNNLYVLFGLNVLAGLVAWASPADAPLPLWPPIAAAALSYCGAAFWLYELAGPGLLALAAIAATCLTGTWLAAAPQDGSAAGVWLWRLDPICGGAVLGVTMAAMLLGHWYLNSPGMSLAPLMRLTAGLIGAVALRAVLSGLGLALAFRTAGPFATDQWLFISLRWLTGVVGAMAVAVVARQTLKVPNTQSATGILYVGVIVTFLGELTAQLLSRSSDFPL